MEEMTTDWMQNEEAARLWGFEVGASFDEVYAPVSMVRLMMWVVSGVIALKETLLSEWKAEVKAVAEETHYGTAAWWVDVVKRWQRGDVLTVKEGKACYEVEDASKRVVTAASVTERGRTLLVKVAKGDVANRQGLNAEEMEELRGYVEQVKPLGVMVTVSSSDANMVDITGVLRYKAERNEQEVREAVARAVGQAFDGLEFNGDLYEGRLAMAIMQVDGVVAVTLGELKIDGQVWSDVVNPSSGYVRMGTDGMNYERV